MPRGHKNLDKLCTARAESPGQIIDIIHVCGEKIHEHPDKHVCKRDFCDYTWPAEAQALAGKDKAGD